MALVREELDRVRELTKELNELRLKSAAPPGASPAEAAGGSARPIRTGGRPTSKAGADRPSQASPGEQTQPSRAAPSPRPEDAHAWITGRIAEFSLDPAVVAAALRTPDTRRGGAPDRIAFEPRAMDRYAADRAVAWLQSAVRRAMQSPQ